MNMVNKYKVERMSDITEFINKENKERFLKDFNTWLDNTIALKEIVGEGAKKFGAKAASVQCSGFTWIDDGKGNETINIKFERVK
jgi:hypothetical protein